MAERLQYHRCLSITYTRYITILSGDLAGNDGPNGDLLNNEENSYHVITAQNVDGTALLNGFTVRGGNADFAAGGDSNNGGGMLILNAGGPSVVRCTFTENHAVQGGPGVAAFGTVSTLATALDLEIDNISHHLRPLRELGLVRVKALKKTRIYSLGDPITAVIRGETLHISVLCCNEERLTIQAKIDATRKCTNTVSSYGNPEAV